MEESRGQFGSGKKPVRLGIRCISAWARNAGPSSEIAILKPNSHRAADMFVDETRDHQRVRRNEATRLYRANWLKRHPKDDPESLPYIACAAAVFEERVWSN